MYEMSESLASFLQRELNRRGWSGRTLAMYADLSPNTIARAVRGESVPDTDTIRKIAVVLEVDETHLLRLAGHVEETPHALSDPSVLAIAYRLEDLAPDVRLRAIQAMDAMIDVAGPGSVSEADKQARIRELKAAIRAAQEYLRGLEGD
jgi:transcriptional regulator with XRE-family HTH domain